MHLLARKKVLLIFFLLLNSSCQFRTDKKVDEPLKIGTLLPLTGDISAFGMPMQDTAELLIKTINDCGGVLGQPVISVSGDDQSVPQIGAEVMTKLAEFDRVSGVIGGASSATSAAAVDIAVRNQVVIISPSSTSPSFTERAKNGDFKGYWFRTAPPDTFQGFALARLLQDKYKFKEISILAVNNEYGRGLATVFTSAFESLNGKVIKKSFYAPDSSFFDSEILSIYKSKPDAVLLIDYSQTGSIVLSTIFKLGLMDKIPLILSDGYKDEDLAERTGKTSDGELVLRQAKNILGTAPSSKGPAYKSFRSFYIQTFGGREPSIYDANTWDAGVSIILAAEFGKSTKGSIIREHIRDVTNAPGVQISDVCKALELIREGTEINYRGAGSEVEFDVQGDVKGFYDVWTVDKNGSIQITDVIKN